MFGRCGQKARILDWDFDDDIVKYEAKELDEYLSRFLDEIRKSDGSDL